MDFLRLGVKFFAESTAPVPVREFIPIFHTWIQNQAVPNHLLIDVHNYSHIHNGPGILLVGAEGNFSIDMADGRMGLLYYRKIPDDGLISIVKTALQGCRLLEAEPALSGRLRFRTSEMQIVANDRLLAPNTEETFKALTPDIVAALQQIFPEGKIKLTRTSINPKDRLTIAVQTGQSGSVNDISSRLD